MVSPAPAGPFAVRTFADWSDGPGHRFVFSSLGEALVFAAKSDRPLIDLVDLSVGRVVAARRAIPHPALDPADPFVPRDDFSIGGAK